MQFHKTGIEGLTVIEPDIFIDQRGYFLESFNREKYQKVTNTFFVQDNESKSTHGVLRGLHYQVPPFAQAKLVRVISGEVLDIALDIRPESRTFGKWFSVILNEENKKQLYIPKGFAHGFVVLSPTAIFAYKCDNFYSKENEGGIRFDDPELGIDWQIDTNSIIVSDKDRQLPNFRNHRKFAGI